MSYLVPLKAFADAVFPRSQARRSILVLRAFFDDSGTHDNSPAVVMAGFIADEPAWQSIENGWAQALVDTGVDKMHMSHCEAANKKSAFAGLDRSQRDLVICRFSEIIQNQGVEVMMLGCAVRSADWLAVSQSTRLLEIFTSPLNFCFNYCFRKAMGTRQASKNPNEPVLITMDSRQQNLGNWCKIASGYEALWPNIVAGYSCTSMAKSCALQAADMVAYEMYRHMVRFEDLGTHPIQRDNFSNLMSSCASDLGLITEENLRAYVRDALEIWPG